MTQDSQALNVQLAQCQQALRNSEARFHSVIDKNADGILVVNQQGTVLYVNPAAETLLGQPASALIGQLVGFPVVAGETSEIDLLRPDGTITAEMRVAETSWNDTPAYLASLRDITEHIELQQALARSRDTLEQHVAERTAELASANEALRAEIRERERIAAALQASETKFRTIYNTANALILAHDTEGNIIYMNPYACRVLGYDVDELISKPIGPLLAPGEGDKAAPMRKQLAENPTQHFEDMEQHYLTKTGETVLINWNVAGLTDTAGQLVGILGVGQNISARKQAEADLQRAYDELEDRVAERTATLAKTNRQLQEHIAERKYVEEALAWEATANAALAELASLIISSASLDDIAFLVLERAKQLTGSAFGFVGYMDPDTGHLVSTTMTRDIWDMCQIPDKTAIFEKFCGLWGWVLDNRSSLLSNDPDHDSRSTGVPEGHIPIHRFVSAPALLADTLVGQIALANPGRDYGERDLVFVERMAALYALAIQRHRAETELQSYADHLEQRVAEKVRELELERAKVIQAGKLAALGEMATGVAHELNQPLTAMLFDADYLKTVVNKSRESGAGTALLDLDELYEIAENLGEDIARCRRIIDHLRAFSRASDGHATKMDLNEVLQNAFILTGERLRLHGVEVRQSLAPDLPSIKADPHKLEQVLLNLISNAEYAMQQREDHEKQSAEPSPYRKILKITTYVDGDDVVATVQDNGIGIPSEEHDHIFEPFYTTKPVGQGTGLGLSISYGIITEFQGNIDFENNVDGGVTFILRFPHIGQDAEVSA